MRSATAAGKICVMIVLLALLCSATAQKPEHKIDAFTDTPILDLKPYIPGYDSVKASVPDWRKKRK